ncbi:hypothetical protein JCM11641_002666, partial [Rhodosporidiobolus odoratus]
TLKDADKRSEFERWVSLADSLKLLVVNYGGPDAKARVQGFETEFGDAKGLWEKLESWYGNTGTGIEKVAVLSKLWHERWDETESPALWFARFTSLSERLNVAYKADALLAVNQTDPSVIAAKHASLNNFLLRNMLISFLPSSFADTLAPSWTNKTTLDEVKTSVQNLWATRTSREEIAGEEARRVAKAGETQQRGKNKGGYQGRKGQQQAPKTFGQNRIPANRYTGHEKWRGGIFVDSAGVKRFKVPPGTCFACFKEGHRRANCEIKGNRQATAKSRAEELRKDDILVPLEDANALSVADLLEPDRATLTALVARLDALPLQNQAFRTLLPPSARPSPPAALPDPSS